MDKRELGLAEQVRIEDILREAGPRFAGADASEFAKEWLEKGLDASAVKDWVAVGVWDPAIAAALRDAGLTALQVQDGAKSLLDGLDEDTRWRLYTGADPILSVCHGDTPVDVLIGASL